MNLDPLNAPENEDMSEVEVCHHCRELIRPGKETEWNGWFWHHMCLPLSVINGREQEARDDMARGK